MNTATIESAVRRICQEIYPSNEKFCWSLASEAELLFELVACILGSQVPYENNTDRSRYKQTDQV